MADARWPAGALALYTAVSWVFLGHRLALCGGMFGAGGDPFLFIWFLAWYPWAIAHHQSLLLTHLVWQPIGMPLAWATSIPLPSILLSPLTLLLGPVVVFNLLILAAPVLAATCAYALCLRVSGNQPGSVLGGFVFGFSGYEMAADYATPNLSLSFLVPCMVLLAWCRLHGQIARIPAFFLAVLLLLAQYFISIEIFATTVVFGALAWLLAYRMLAQLRPRLLALLADALLAGAFTMVLLLPILAQMLAHRDFVNLPAAWPYCFVNDLMSFLVPTPLTLLGGGWAAPFTNHFPGLLQEKDGYVGLPLVLILAAYIAATRRERACLYLGLLAMGFAVLSLGPELWVAGHFTGAILPWSYLVNLPLLGSALPARFALYTALALALILSLWIGRAPRSKLRMAAGVAACLALLPAPHRWEQAQYSSFFRAGEAETVLGPNATVLVLPFASVGAATFWQVENRFGFAQSGGYLGFPPRPMQHFKAVPELFANLPGPHFGADITEFCMRTKAQFVVAGPGTIPAMRKVMDGLGWPRRAVDDVVVYTVPGAHV